MFDARKRPGGRDDKSVNVIFDRELSINFREAKIVADAESETQVGKGKTGEAVAWRKYLCSSIGAAVKR